ncbi:hypothetical protein GW937_00685 [Candidatus Kaiserbacteria bacterium]|nr:hypothetical protein [Candidatus Kaiserbacteria bacterium]NCT01868.1 hypothetical protein [Candidatus Parcubacteria bacterium]
MIVFLGLFSISAFTVEAASLVLSPSTGVYTTNSTFTVRVAVNTDGKPVNAAEGTLTFNPRELSVVSVNRTGSIFNLWVTEPTFSNSAGTINFSGGLPAGYTGGSGTIMNITFRATGAGTARASFTNGSVLANDGKGTNILSAMNGGNYTIQAPAATPLAEVIEYVAPANTPAAPKIISATHKDATLWYNNREAVVSWSLPTDIVAVRTLLDTNPTTIPTKVYDDPIKTLTLADLPEGVSYFHVQFKNTDGWGKVTHYRLAIDTERPTSINITQSVDVDRSNPDQTLLVKTVDATSAVKRFKIKVDAAEPFEYLDTNASDTIPLPALEPGYHTIVVEAFDEAGNSIIGTYAVTIEAFDKPLFTEYPAEINSQVIPVIKGTTRPNATVEITLTRIGAESMRYVVQASLSGEFVFIPEGRFSTGVYELVAIATDQFGAKSTVSEAIRIAVQESGFIRIGSLIVNILSVMIPLIILLVSLLLGIWYLVLYARRFRGQVNVESTEALSILRREFTELQTMLSYQERILANSKKTKKLTTAENAFIEAIGAALLTSQQKVEKEITDITALTTKNNK